MSSSNDWTTVDILTLPSIATIEAEDKDRHGFIGTPRLLLRTRRLDGLATTTRKQTGIEHVTLDTAHGIDLVFIGLIPIQALGIDQFLRLLGTCLTRFGTGQLLRRHGHQVTRRDLSQDDIL